ncbi:Cyclopropane fatty-acyl-phospholipid synthase [Rhodospirillales bacterium URHD0017]|nr:Cyclopropane fatty-acyl-phospholipid synthase [Rhodospirillales bacterium URHD0017]
MSPNNQIEKSTQEQPNWLDRVIEYYDQTRFDYRVVWQNSDNLAFHFGYYEPGIQEHAHALSNANRVLSKVAGVQSGDRVLDAGCGVGGSSLWLARHHAVEVVGITPVEHQVAQAREIARQRGLQDRVTFEQVDYLRTPFPDASFDVVWALESLCHAVDKRTFYREAFRLLRPRGRLVVAEYVRTGRNLDPASVKLMDEWLAGWSMPDLDTAEEHISAAQNVGFAATKLDDYTWATRRSLSRLYKLSLTGWSINQAFYRLGLRSEAQHRNVVASRRQYELLMRGAWFYGVLSATKQ